MVFGGSSKRAALVVAALLAMAGPVGAQGSAAEKIADKFASDTAEAQRRADEQRKKDSERKAQEALREQARKRAEEALKADREREKQKALAAAAKKPKADPEPVAQETPAMPTLEPAPQAEAPRIDPQAEEDEMLARARHETEQRRKAEAAAQVEAEARRAIERIITEGSAPKRAEVATSEAMAVDVVRAKRVWQRSVLRIAAADAEAAARARQIAEARRSFQRSADRIATQEKAVAEAAQRAQAVADARRTFQRSASRIAAHERAEAKALAEAAIPAPPARDPSLAAPERERVVALPVPTPPVLPPMAPQAEPVLPPQASISRGLSPGAPATLEPRVTVLILMEPGTRGIRRHNKKADPVLCVNEGCYVSAGADAPASFMPGRLALGLANTWGNRAGACRNQLGCVFRSVAVADLPLVLQPVDLRVVKHDRRHMVAISGDSQCRLDGGRLACARGIVEDDYVMWIVPESLARTAGPSALERALQDGLSGPQSAAVGNGRF